MFRLLLVVWGVGSGVVDCCLESSKEEVKIEIGENRIWRAELPEASKNGIQLVSEHPDIIAVATSLITTNLEINLTGLAAGKSEVFSICGTTAKSETEEHFMLHVQVHRSKVLDYISITFGWLYFVAWSICFYPQIYHNYKTKSVVGLSFDGVLFEVLGYYLYNAFNVSMAYIPVIKRQYSERYPKGILPVLTNDLVFSMHGVVVTSATAYQCMIYYREKQTVSMSATITMVLCILTVATSIVLAALDVILWLDTVYLCSYIKMYGSVMVYLPQAYMNYKRQNTSGFSITGIIIDLLGSIFCNIQMVLDGYNYDDWKTFLENPAKFGLSVVTLGLTVVFIVQHYILYSKCSKNFDVEMKHNHSDV